ncbi:MAG TPA: AMIN domain-containing protein, partial [Myxococcales bacterium]|nr:AMIN domain-containing protein [Myxococcales bacterium]
MRRKALPSTILLLGLAFAAGADDRARLLSITAGGDADSSVVAVEGDRPLSFTTLQLQTPPRVVVDFADTSVAGVPAELSVEDGTVRRVATADAGSGTARVVIELAADAEFDVRAKGNRLEVRVPRIAPFVAQAAPPKPEATPPNPAAEPSKPEVVASKPEAPAERPAAAAPPETSIEHAPAAQAPASAEAEKRASLPTVSLIGSRPAAPPPEPKPVSAAEEKKRHAAEKLAAQKRAIAEAAEARRRAKEERLASAAAAKKAAANRAAEARRAAAEARRAAAEARHVAAEKRLALLAEKKAKASQEAEEKKKLALARPAPAPRAPAVEEPRTLTVQEAMALRAAAEQGLPTGLGPAAAPPPPKPPAEKPEPRHTARAEPAPAGRGNRIAINSIGFRPVGNGEVIIRSDKPLTYGVGGDEHSVLLHLPGSAIPRPNDRRPLDTHFFDGP